MSGLDLGSKHPPLRTLTHSINFDSQCLTTPLWGRSYYHPIWQMGNWGIERSDLPKVSHYESIQEVGTRSQHPLNSYSSPLSIWFLRVHLGAKGSRVSTHCSANWVNSSQPHGLRAVTYLAYVRDLGETNCSCKPCANRCSENKTTFKIMRWRTKSHWFPKVVHWVIQIPKIQKEARPPPPGREPSPSGGLGSAPSCTAGGERLTGMWQQPHPLQAELGAQEPQHHQPPSCSF